jgi:MoxR-like ATPase
MVKDKYEEAGSRIAEAREEISKVIVGQNNLLDKIFISLIAQGHILIEGVPGLAKTKTVKTLSKVIGGSWSRVQFTPDLVPSDITGSRIYNPKTSEFSIETGPILSNFLLADEINRAPAKVQSALLEAMEERQITIAKDLIALPKPFIVLATQNPIEQDGTYPLPEAQLDRFMLRVIVEHPNEREELEIIRREINSVPDVENIFSLDDILYFQELSKKVFLSKEIAEFIVKIISLTRESTFKGEKSPILLGASPRATIYLAKAAQAKALLEGRRAVRIEDVLSLATEVIAHRLILNYESIADGETQITFMTKLIDTLRG